MVLFSGNTDPSAVAGEDAAAIRITGPNVARIATEVVLRAEPANAAAEKILKQGGFFEWAIANTVLATGNTFRCRSAEPAEYEIEARLRRHMGTRWTTEATTQQIIVFTLAPPPPTTSSSPPQSPRWVLKSQRSFSETNEQRAAQNSLELSENSCSSRSAAPEVGTIEWRMRWPTFPRTLTPGNRLIFDIQQEMRLAAGGSAPLAATAHARFFAISKVQHERIIETMTETIAAGETNRFVRTKRIQWQIPTGRMGDELSLEVGGQSPAGTVSRFFVYQMTVESATSAPSIAPGTSKVRVPPPSPLRLALSSETTNAPVGSLVRIRAVPQGGVAPLRFAWSVDGLALTDTTAQVTVLLARPGAIRISAEAMDSAEQSARAMLILSSEAPLVRIAKISPAGQTIFVGEPVTFRAEVVGRIAIPLTQCRFRWVADETTAFDALETDTATNVARFYRSGMVTVRVDLVHAPAPLAFETIARSPLFSLNVLPPAIVITFDPEEPFVAEEFKVQVRSDPALPGLEARWLDLPSNVDMVNRSADGRDLRCLLKDIRTAMFKVELALPRFGVVVGKSSAQLVAKPRRIILSGPVGASPQPQIWHEGQGLVTLTNEFMPGQPLQFAATLVPSNGEVRWVWSLSDHNSNLEAPRSATPKVICASTGHYEIMVRAYDSRDIELAAAKKSFSVNISAEATAKAQQRAEAASLREKGFTLLAESRHAEAVQAFRDSYALWPSEELRRHIAQLERQLSQDQAAAEQAAALRREEETRPARAMQLKQQGWEHIQAKRYDQALTAFQQSLDLQPDAQLEKQMRQIRDALEKRRARQVEAQRWRKEAETFEAAGRLKEALEAYRASYASWQDDAIEQAIARLEKRMASEESVANEVGHFMQEGAHHEQQGDWNTALRAYQKAHELRAGVETAAALARVQEKIRQHAAQKKAAEEARKEGDALRTGQRIEEALLKYREALRLWPDQQLKKQVEDLEREWQVQRKKQQKAAEWRDQAAALALGGDLEAALTAYRESVKLVPDAKLDRRIREIESELARRQAIQAQARQLANDAAQLETAGQWEDALRAYRDSLALEYSSNIAARIRILEQKIDVTRQRRIEAAKLREQAAIAAAEGRLEKAVELYRKSLELETDAATSDQLAKLEKKFQMKQVAAEKAKQLYREGLQLEHEERLEEAAAKYRECLVLVHHDEAQRRLSTVQRLLQRRAAEKQRLLTEQKAKERMAAKLREEGRAFEETEQWEEAMARYRASLDLLPDSDLEQRIRTIEAQRAESAEKVQRANTLCAEAHEALLAGRLEEAIQKYEASLAYRSDPMALDTITRLKEELALRQKQTARAAKLVADAQERERAGQYAEAATLLRESLLLRSDIETRRLLAKVEARLREQSVMEKAAKLASESKQKAAQKLFSEAAELEKLNRLSEAIAKYRFGLVISPDPDIEQKVAALELRVAEIQKANEEARRLELEGAEWERQDRLEEAIERYQLSLQIASNSVLEQHVAVLKQKLEEREQKKHEAQRWAEKGDVLAQEGRVAEATEAYRQSLALHPNEAVRQKMAALEKQFEALQEQTSHVAAKLQEARSAMASGDFEGARSRVKDVLTIAPEHEEAKQLQINIEKAINERETARRQASDEAARADELEKQGQWADAASAYQRSLALAFDARVEERLQALQQRIVKRDAQRAQAAKLQSEAQSLAAQKDWAEALAKYRESLALWPNAKVEKEIARLNKQWQREKQDQDLALRLRQEAERLESEGRWEEALAKYRDSAAIHRNSELDALIARTQGLVEQERAKSQMADRTWTDGMLQFRSGKYREGLALLKQSLALQSNAQRQNVLNQMEAWVASVQNTPQQPSPPPAADASKAKRSDSPSSPPLRAEVAVQGSSPSEDVMVGSRWEGVALFQMGDEWIQWPLQLVIHAGYNLAGSNVDQDSRTRERIEYNLSGIYESPQKKWYMVCTRRDLRSISKATLSGTHLTETTAGGPATLFLQDAGGRQSVKGFWRLMCIESDR